MSELSAPQPPADEGAEEPKAKRGRQASPLTQMIRTYEKTSLRVERLTRRLDTLNGTLANLELELIEARSEADEARKSLEQAING